jgi:hypothetical protein
MMPYMLCLGPGLPPHLGSFSPMGIVGNSDHDLFLATEFILGRMIMRGVHNGKS